MKTITQVGQAIQKMLGPVSDELAVETNFTQRKSKITGSVFMQALVFSSLEDPDWRYSNLVAGAMNAGVSVTKQAMEQRFTPASAALAQRVLERAVETVIETEAIALPLLERFQGVYIRDSSTITLPQEMDGVWPGVGGSLGSTAGVKLHTRLEVCSGRLAGPILAPAREHDQASPFQGEALPAGALRMGDLGFFSLKQFTEDTRKGVYWLTRYRSGTCIYDPQGQRMDLLTWLSKLGGDQAECRVQIGKTQQLPCRLLVERVPPSVAEKRKRKLREYARKKQTPLTTELLALANWTLILTNVPPRLLSLPEALVLLRVRWQIELLFKRWKSLFKVDEWRSQNIWRIMTELFAKLLGAVITQWIQLSAMNQVLHPSFWKAALVVRKFASCLAISFSFLFALERCLALIAAHFRAYCYLDSRSSRPSLFHLLDNPLCTTLP